MGCTDLLWKSSTNRQATEENSSQATEGMCKMAPAVNSGSIGSHRKQSPITTETDETLNPVATDAIVDVLNNVNCQTAHKNTLWKCSLEMQHLYLVKNRSVFNPFGSHFITSRPVNI